MGIFGLPRLLLGRSSLFGRNDLLSLSLKGLSAVDGLPLMPRASFCDLFEPSYNTSGLSFCAIKASAPAN